MTRSRAALDRVIFEEIARRRASGERGVDILSLLLDAEDEDGSRLSDQELRDQVMTLLFAGHDTATSTVTFMFYELARNPHEIAPLVEELDRVGDRRHRGGAGRRPAAAGHGAGRDAAHVPARLDRAAPVDRAVRAAGVHVPGGVFVNYCSWASHHLPGVFPEPERFRPDRFAPEAKAALPKGAYVPFGGGSRTCIGMRFGQLEVKAIAAGILRRFDLELTEPDRAVDPPDADAVAARRAAGRGAGARLSVMGGAWLEQATSTV